MGARRDRFLQQHPIFALLRDESLPPERRLAWAPYIVPFNMGYRDFNINVIRGPADTTDPIQKVLNVHSYEEEFHWHWLLEDLATLGFNPELPLHATVRLLWSEELTVARTLPTRLAVLCARAPSSHKYAVVESIESTSIALYTLTKTIRVPGKRLAFFGEHHWEAESAHTALSDEDPCKDIVLSPEERRGALACVDAVYQGFAEWADEQMALVARYGTDFERAVADIVARSERASGGLVREWDRSRSAAPLSEPRAPGPGAVK